MALVGYTNAGKSTLFNRLTASACTRPTSCRRRSTRRCAASTCRAATRSSCPTRSASSATCRDPRRRLPATLSRPRRPTSCCTSWTSWLDRDEQAEAGRQRAREIGADRVPARRAEQDRRQGPGGRAGRLWYDSHGAPECAGRGRVRELVSALAEFPPAGARRRTGCRPGSPDPSIALTARYLPGQVAGGTFRGLRTPHVAQRSPMGQAGGSGNSGGPPDLDEIWRNVNRRLAEMFGRRGRRRDAARRAAAAADGLLLSGAVLVALVRSSGSRERLLHRRRGPPRRRDALRQVHRDHAAGPALAPSVPRSSRSSSSTSQVKTIEIGYRNSPKNRRRPRGGDADLRRNIIDIQFAVQYNIKNAEDHVFQNRKPGPDRRVGGVRDPRGHRPRQDGLRVSARAASRSRATREAPAGTCSTASAPACWSRR